MEGRPQRFSIPIQHFYIDAGFEFPILNGVFEVTSRVRRDEIEISRRGTRIRFHVFSTTACYSSGANFGLRSLEGGPSWRGEIVVIRRAKYKQAFVNFRRGDDKRAVKAAF